MPRYYFDSGDNERIISDEIGVEVASLEEAKTLASAAMAELAKDVLPGSVVRRLVIEVRDDFGPLFRACLRFEIEPARQIT